MGVRIIGAKSDTAIRIQSTTGGDGSAETGERVQNFVAVGEQHTVDATDNDSESDIDGQAGFVDPDTIADTGSSSGGTGKRRGRPRGSRNSVRGTGSGRTSARSTSKTTDSVAAMLFTIHSVAGSLLKIPAVQIPKSSCNDLAEAIMQVTELYEIPLLDEKGMAWANLAAVACKVYIFNGNATVVKNEDNVTVISDPIPMPAWMVNGSGKAN